MELTCMVLTCIEADMQGLRLRSHWNRGLKVYECSPGECKFQEMSFPMYLQILHTHLTQCKMHGCCHLAVEIKNKHEQQQTCPATACRRRESQSSC